MKTNEIINAQSPLTQIEWWLTTHNVALYADLTTYYAVCCGFGFLSGLLTGSVMVRAF